jgi:hypothetical protein
MGILGAMLGRPGTASHGEMLSFVFFDPDFHRTLARLGAAHTQDALGPGPGLRWRY